METRKKVVLIDGHSILNRAFYGVPELTNSAGLHTNAVYGFLNILLKLLEEERADYLAVAFDLPAPTFRHERYAEYKGTRKSMPDELREQVPLLKELLAAMNIKTVSLEGYEADDVIGTLAKRYQKEGLEVTVVSGDRDLLQLADSHILIRLPKTSRGKTEILDFTPAAVKETYGVTPEEFIDVKGLMGDSSDNIPGVPSIGEKTATALIQSWHSIENLKEHLEEVKPPRAKKALEEHFEDAVFSKWLATICLDAPIQPELSELKIRELYTSEAYEQIQRLEFRSLLKHFGSEVQREHMRAQHRPRIELIQTEEALWEAAERAVKADEIGIARGELLTAFCSDAASVSVVFRRSPQAAELLKLKALTEQGEGLILEPETERKLLSTFFERGKTVSGLDIKPFLKEVGTEERDTVDDLGVLAYLLNPLKESYRSEDIARDYLSLLLPSAKEDAVAAEAYEAYVAFAARKPLREKVSEQGMEKLYSEIERPLVFMLAEMEENGVAVDAEKLKAFSDELESEIHRIEDEIFAETGEEFNLNSPKQLGEILFDKMKLPYGKKTKSGYSTAADILEKLAPEYPVVKKILRYRMLTKLNSTYALGLAAYIQADGRIHGSFHQTITATGRISSANPNLQNIPIRTEMGSRVRAVFVPAPGKVFVDADYSQIELRILAALSGDENLIAAYRDAVDVHAVTASQVFHVPLDEVTPLQRRNAKAVNFGVVYGISAFGLSEDLSISRNEAKEYINRYFESYPEVKRFLDRQIKEAKEYGFTRTLFGRIRPVPELKSSNFMQRAFGERVAMNAPIQGTAADIMKIAMVKVRRALESENLDARIVLQIHDELLVEADETVAPRVLELLKETMRNAAELRVSLEVDAHIGNSWLEAH
ncbi:DNA polymerase I [Stomatobaculum longum]|uniref:DNA polymerase I n=1 Tax=Stomatobaculum longum TaxID=796942 RepID=UPI0028DCD476|nr:DNA polymerase I [Stomatobaculum longum]